MDQVELRRLITSEIEDTMYDTEVRLKVVHDALHLGAVDEDQDGLDSDSCEGLMMAIEDILHKLGKSRRRYSDFVEKQTA